MRRLVIILVCLVACSAPTTSDGPRASVRVSPRTATINVGGSQQLSAATLNAAGDSTGLATVTWSSSTSSVASVSSDGIATGLVPGVTMVVATTSDGPQDSAQITVVAQACNDIAHTTHLQGTATFTYTYSTLLNSVQYGGNDSSTMTFTANALGGGQSGHLLWIGSSTGTGAEHETRTDHVSGDVRTLIGSGALVVSDINLSHVIIAVDLSTCAYTLEGNPYIDLVESPDPGDLGPSWIGWFRTAPTPLGSGSHSASLATHSVDWLGPNYAGASGWYVPLGFSSDYFSDGAPDDGSLGAATISYSVTSAP
ncbi:MAG TPA: Ig-like domain-containing protein [Gemmatimonadaceae bacterium]